MLSIYSMHGHNFTSGGCEDCVIPFCTSSHIEIYVTCYSTNIVPSPTECESSMYVLVHLFV